MKGWGIEEGKQSDVSAYSRAKGKRNITPLLRSTSAAKLVLLHQEAKPTPVHHLNPLEDPGPSHATSTSCYIQVERSARLEWEGYDQVVWLVENGVSVSGTR